MFRCTKNIFRMELLKGQGDCVSGVSVWIWMKFVFYSASLISRSTSEVIALLSSKHGPSLWHLLRTGVRLLLDV